MVTLPTVMGFVIETAFHVQFHQKDTADSRGFCHSVLADTFHVECPCFDDTVDSDGFCQRDSISCTASLH